MAPPSPSMGAVRVAYRWALTCRQVIGCQRKARPGRGSDWAVTHSEPPRWTRDPGLPLPPWAHLQRNAIVRPSTSTLLWSRMWLGSTASRVQAHCCDHSQPSLSTHHDGWHWQPTGTPRRTSRRLVLQAYSRHGYISGARPFDPCHLIVSRPRGPAHADPNHGKQQMHSSLTGCQRCRWVIDPAAAAANVCTTVQSTLGRSRAGGQSQWWSESMCGIMCLLFTAW